jgi:hypothetical protein
MYRRSNWLKRVDYSTKYVENAEVEMLHLQIDAGSVMEATFDGRIES